MDFTFTNEINSLDLIGFVGWAIGLFAGVSWLKRRYGSRIESDPMRIFQSHVTDLEKVAAAMENSEDGYFTRRHDDSEESQAFARVAQTMANYRIQDMVYRNWLIACRISNRKGERPYLHVRRLPGLYIVDHR